MAAVVTALTINIKNNIYSKILQLKGYLDHSCWGSCHAIWAIYCFHGNTSKLHRILISLILAVYNETEDIC